MLTQESVRKEKNNKNKMMNSKTSLEILTTVPMKIFQTMIPRNGVIKKIKKRKSNKFQFLKVQVMIFIKSQTLNDPEKKLEQQKVSKEFHQD